MQRKDTVLSKQGVISAAGGPNDWAGAHFLFKPARGNLAAFTVASRH
jgi:hypothetical protein